MACCQGQECRLQTSRRLAPSPHVRLDQRLQFRRTELLNPSPPICSTATQERQGPIRRLLVLRVPVQCPAAGRTL